MKQFEGFLVVHTLMTSVAAPLLQQALFSRGGGDEAMLL